MHASKQGSGVGVFVGVVHHALFNRMWRAAYTWEGCIHTIRAVSMHYARMCTTGLLCTQRRAACIAIRTVTRVHG